MFEGGQSGISFESLSDRWTKAEAEAKLELGLMCPLLLDAEESHPRPGCHRPWMQLQLQAARATAAGRVGGHLGTHRLDEFYAVMVSRSSHEI